MAPFCGRHYCCCTGAPSQVRCSSVSLPVQLTWLWSVSAIFAGEALAKPESQLSQFRFGEVTEQLFGGARDHGVHLAKQVETAIGDVGPGSTRRSWPGLAAVK